MSDYNLSGLNSREFEHLIQALTMRVIASGVRPFGDGKDGGREATYEGRMSYPSDTEPWNGYLVIQAKFLQRPFRVDDEGSWALSQLEGELKKYLDPGCKPRKPEYYVFATNAVFTPVPRTGTIDRAESLLNQYAAKIGIRGYDFWDHDKICRLLDGEGEIRRRYAPFINAGDVLTQVAEMLRQRRPNFDKVMVLHLQKQLWADQYVRLGQAGHAADPRTSLAQVFTDLLAFEEPRPEPVEESVTPGGRLPDGFVATVLGLAGQLLDPRTLAERETGESGDAVENQPEAGAAGRRQPRAGRYVLVGGPGQGKTTLGQYLCQVFRASILRARPRAELSPDAARALDEVCEQCQRDGIHLPIARRFPVRVVLSQFAETLAERKVASLIEFLTSQINASSQAGLTEADLKDWFAAHPWLIVLDGLDEVPSSSNREELAAAVAGFWSDMAFLNSDVLTVATTRPQGYEHEFSPADYRHYYLAPLSTARALNYAKKLVELRNAGDDEAQKLILDRIERAIREPSTARLMRSPLQVAIMSMLVERFGDPPSQRWPMFQEYYGVIFRRESSKAGSHSAVLRQYRAHIDVIHQRVGLRLQAEGESAGATDASLTKSEFGSLVRGRLVEVGYEGEELEVASSQIIEAAMDRLVFLVAPRAGRVGFEIRSLQEFMAAWALMHGDDPLVRVRLEAISPYAYWRNVFLFAAGCCVIEREHAFDGLIALTSQLNETPAESAVTLQGSRLALDLLEDGLVRDYPGLSRSLARCAARLLILPPEIMENRLAAQVTHQNEEVFFEQIRDRLNQKDIFSQLAAWDLLYRLSDRGNSKATALLRENWPCQPSDRLEVFRVIREFHRDRWLVERLIEVLPFVTPAEIARAELFQEYVVRHGISLPPWFVAAIELGGRHRETAGFELRLRLSADDPPVRFRYRSVRPEESDDLIPLAGMPSAHPAWRPLVAAARFAERPSKTTMADALREVASVWRNREYEVRIPHTEFPWPLAACIEGNETPDDFLRMAQRADSGSLGDLEDWLAAEALSREGGLDRENMLRLTDETWPFDPESLRSGLPIAGASVKIEDSQHTNYVQELLRVFDRAVSRRVRGKLSEIILALVGFDFFRHRSSLQDVDPKKLLELLTSQRSRRVNLSLFARIDPPSLFEPAWVEVLDYVGRECIVSGFHYSNSKLLPTLATLTTIYPGKVGLANMLASLLLLGYQHHAPLDMAPPPTDADPRTRLCILITSLFRSTWGEEDAGRLADSARSLVREHPYYVNPIMDYLEERKKDSAGAARFLIQLLGTWPRERWPARRRAIELIKGVIQQQKSGLSDPQVGSSLGLPHIWPG